MSAAITMTAPPLPAPTGAENTWTDVCALDDVPPFGAVCVLVQRRQVAIFRPGAGDELYALDNFDPFSKAYVLSRGIMGDRGGVLKIASPIFKQSFDLRTGVCLDDAAVRVAVFPIRISDGRVEISGHPLAEAQ